jgi:hypothetical protein
MVNNRPSRRGNETEDHDRNEGTAYVQYCRRSCFWKLGKRQRPAREPVYGVRSALPKNKHMQRVVQSASSLYIWPTLRLQLHRESEISMEVLWCTFMIMYSGGTERNAVGYRYAWETPLPQRLSRFPATHLQTCASENVV